MPILALGAGYYKIVDNATKQFINIVVGIMIEQERIELMLSEQVCFRQVNNFISLAIQYRLYHIECETLDLFQSNRCRHRQLLSVHNYINQSWTLVL